MTDFTNLAILSFCPGERGDVFEVDERPEFISHKFLVSQIEHQGINSVISKSDVPVVVKTRETAIKLGKEYSVEYTLNDLQYASLTVKEVGTPIKRPDYDSMCIKAHLYIEYMEDGSKAVLGFSGIGAMLEAVNQAAIVSVANKSGKIIYVNDLFLEYSKYSREELIGQDHRIINSGYHPKSYFINLWKTISSGKVWKGEIRNRAKDGTFYWVDTVISPVFNEEKKVVQYVSIRTVITERKIAEQTLKKRETMLNNAQHIAKIGSWELDVSNAVLEWTDEVYKIFERDKKTFQPSYELFLELVHPDDREKVDRAYAESLEKKKRYKIEHRYITSDGKTKYVLEQSEHQFNEAGDQIKSFGTVQDITELKQVSLLLEHQRNRLDSILTATELGVWEWETGSENLKINPGWAKSIGYTLQELEPVTIKSWVELIHPDDVEKFFKSFKRLTSGQLITCQCELRLKHKDGRWIYMLEKGTVIETDDDGNPKQIYGVQQNITELKEKELEVEKSSIRYRNLLENISNGFMVDNLKGEVVFANKRFYEIFKLKPSKNQKIDFSRYIHPDYVEQLQDRHNRRIRGEKVESTFEYKGVTGVGDHIWLHVRAAAVEEDGEVVGTQSVITDITEQKYRERQLQELAEFNSMIIASTDDVFYIKDASSPDPMEHAFVYISDKINKTTGVSADLLIRDSKAWFDFIYPEDRPGYIEHLNRIRSSGSSNSFIYRIVKTDGRVCWVMEHTNPHCNVRTKELELYGSLTDITELKEKEKHLEDLLQEVNEKNNELLQFNYIVSHNLRAPIVNAIGLMDLMNNNTLKMDQEQAHYIGLLSRSINQMDEVVKDLNKILETKSLIGSRFEDVSIRKVLDSIRGTLESQISETKTHFVMELDQNADEIHTIKSFLESILYNLISNAIKYRSTDRNPEVIVRTTGENGSIVIEVSDNGVGFDLTKHSDDLFGLYKRFSHNTSGKGLGLHMTKNQVEAMNGTIQVDSKPGKGTTFTVRLPVSVRRTNVTS